MSQGHASVVQCDETFRITGILVSSDFRATVGIRQPRRSRSRRSHVQSARRGGRGAGCLREQDPEPITTHCVHTFLDAHLKQASASPLNLSWPLDPDLEVVH
jgi:hypothetical protein